MTRRCERTLRTGWVATVVVAIAALLPASHARPAECGVRTERTRFGTWATIPLPATPPAPVDPLSAAFPAQSLRNEIHAYAVDPADASVLYVADEWTVMRSTDRGCHWSKSFSVLDEDEPSPESNHIVSLAAVATASGATRVYALLRRGAQWFSARDASVTVPRLAVRKESGRWSVHDPLVQENGAPVTGEASRLWIARGGDLMYLRVNDYSRTGPALYASEDGGRTWALRALQELVTPVAAPGSGACPTQTDPCTGIDQRMLAVDPRDATRLWAGNTDSVVSSEDEGRTWATISEWSPWNGAIQAIRVFHPKGKAATVVVFGLWKVARSSDGGSTWRVHELPSDAAPTPFVAGRSPGELVYVGEDYRARLTNLVRTQDISPGTHGDRSPSTTRLRDVSYVAATDEYFFLGGTIGDNGLRWGNSLLSFTPAAGNRSR